MQNNLFEKLDRQRPPVKEGNTIWFFSKKQRDKKLRHYKQANGTDKFGNCLNGYTPIDHYGPDNKVEKWGIWDIPEKFYAK